MGQSEGHIRGRREALGLSQQALADQLGVDKSYLSLLESGKRPLTEDHAKTLSIVLGVLACPHRVIRVQC
jgi:transcriptional regulator with XRE-family HTH domain